MLDLSRFPGRVVATRTIPPRAAKTLPIPGDVHPALQAALKARGIAELYCHQVEAFAAARGGEDVVVTTGTASGKSLAYLLPVIQSVLEDPSARAILLYPTKALTQDQLRGVLGLVEDIAATAKRRGAIQAGVYDGDTPPADRARIRDRCNLVLTNPDMLCTGLLPNHGRRGFAHLFRNVRYLVLDELHTYRGAFGAHFANLMRRFHRVCQHYGSTPRILASSATIANAKEHAETLCQRQFRLIDDDGSPSAGKIVHFWQPPLNDHDMRRPVTSEMAALLPELIKTRHRTIAFCKSRKETEIVLKETRDRLRDVAGHDESELIAGYRAGYTPEERRTVERSLVDGKLLGVVSTNALELGIDIGRLQVVVQGGFPGTRASFWQQMGRAGRRNELAHAIVILAVSPTDQLIADDPDWLVGQSAERAVLDPSNLAIQLAHVRAAAAELPLVLDDAARFPDLGEIASILERAGELRDVAGAWHWVGGPFPAGELSLRNLHEDRFKVVNRDTGTTITEMSRPQVYREAHTRAVYLHDGVQYQIEALDLVAHVATVVEVEQNFYTQPDVRTAIDVILTQEKQSIGRSAASFGDVRVNDTVVGYKMLEFHNHQNLGYEELHEHLSLELETEALWIAVPEQVLSVLGAENEDALAGLVHALGAAARRRTMAERSDLSGTSFRAADEETGQSQVSLILYDSHPGGLGWAQSAFEGLDEVLTDALRLIEGCRCRSGCPACVGSYGRDRALLGWAMRSFFEELAPPQEARSQRAPVEARPLRTDLPPVRAIPWEEAAVRWREVLDDLSRSGVDGATLLASLPAPETFGNRLQLTVESAGLKDWLTSPAVARRLAPAIFARLLAPPEASLSVVVSESTKERGLLRRLKLGRRHDDLVADRPGTERAATEKLASGYLLESERAQPSPATREE